MASAGGTQELGRAPAVRIVSAMADDAELSPKAARTRARILDAALELLFERGFEKTTMRAIAERAGVSVGNAYYYFDSKESLVQAFYRRTHEEHLRAAEPLLARRGALAERLLTVMESKLDTLEPYHEFAGVLFRTAADPQSPLNPFSDASRPLREEATLVFARVVAGSTTKIHADVAPELPDLLWTWHMGIVLHWVHDTSPGRRRTRRLLAHSTELIAKLVALASQPLLRPLRKSMLDMLADLRADLRAD